MVVIVCFVCFCHVVLVVLVLLKQTRTLQISILNIPAFAVVVEFVVIVGGGEVWGC